jgi:hypothetical protein
MGHRRRELVDATNGVYRYDQLIVLRTTQMPAVLLEAGSIVNRKEELELAKPDRVALVADAATHAVETYCDAHGHHIAEAPLHPAHAPGQTVRHVRRPSLRRHPHHAEAVFSVALPLTRLEVGWLNRCRRLAKDTRAGAAAARSFRQ